jgi:hypothetical protein
MVANALLLSLALLLAISFYLMGELKFLIPQACVPTLVSPVDRERGSLLGRSRSGTLFKVSRRNLSLRADARFQHETACRCGTASGQCL